MKKLLLGMAVGAVVGYTVHKCQEKKFFEKMYHNVGLFGLRVRKQLMNNMDSAKNEMEYVSDCAEEEVHDLKNRNDDVLNEISY